MILLLTNDDGFDAPGIQALFGAAALLGSPVIVAPAGALSGCSHRVTTHGPIRVEADSGRGWTVHGTPADCVRLALHQLAPETAWVLAGINQGGNLGADVYHSGTVAAVREGVLHGRPGIAVSQYHRKGVPLDWRRAAAWVAPLLGELVARPWSPGTFWNINLPHLDPDDPDPETVFCPLDPSPLPLSFRAYRDSQFCYDGDYHGRPRQPGSDVDVCFRGKIAVTRIVLW
jgi:5'-nucleotidase